MVFFNSMLYLAEGQGGFGILGMKERFQKIGGSFQIESMPGKGTRVNVKAPMNSRERSDHTGNDASQVETE
jgi:glucose-6-phosphate-specific signal transduction histidine kinase